MREKETRPSVAALERSEETAADVRPFPCVQSNTSSGKKQGRVESLLNHGAGNAIPTAELIELAGFKTSRQLQAQVEMERLDGALILSTSKRGGGYYLPADGPEGRQEINDFIRTLNARAINTLRTLKAARRALTQLDGQEVLRGI